MIQIPRSINTWEKLQYFIRCIEEMVATNTPFNIPVVAYSPWDKASKKVKNYGARINLFEVPEAYHIIAEHFNVDAKLNYVPTLIRFTNEKVEKGVLKFLVTVNDNATAIQHELASGG